MSMFNPLLRHKISLVSVLALAAVCTFSLLWMRKQVYLQSQFGNELERKLEKLSREMHRINVRIANFHSSNFLMNKCASNMAHPTRNQTLWINDSTTLVYQSNSKLGTVAKK